MEPNNGEGFYRPKLDIGCVSKPDAQFHLSFVPRSIIVGLESLASLKILSSFGTDAATAN